MECNGMKCPIAHVTPPSLSHMELRQLMELRFLLTPPSLSWQLLSLLLHPHWPWWKSSNSFKSSFATRARNTPDAKFIPLKAFLTNGYPDKHKFFYLNYFVTGEIWVNRANCEQYFAQLLHATHEKPLEMSSNCQVNTIYIIITAVYSFVC